MTLTQEKLQSLLHYDPDTGVFTWKVARQRVKNGDVAGYKKSGYVYISINGKHYRAHRLAFLYVHGEFPKEHTDHINGVRNDNRIANLREATNSQNMQNLLVANSNNKTGLLGASVDKATGKFQAQIKLNGKNKFLGRFNTALEAHHAYVQEKRRVHDFCTI